MPASAIREGANLDDLKRITRSDAARVDDLPSQAQASKQSAFASVTAFVQDLLPQAKQFAEQIGLNPHALVAQAAVETGWGQRMIHAGDGRNSHNLFGIKADHRWQGDKAHVDTLEYENGVAQKQRASFRAYDSFADSMADYVSFIKDNPRYQQALQRVSEPRAYFDALQRAGYATDPGYADKIMKVLGGDTLRSALSSAGN